MRAALLATLFLVGNGIALRADEIDFVRDVQPIFARHCLKCHGPEKQESGLRLDLRSRALEGGDSGVAIVPRDSAGSALLKRVASPDPDDVMPPEGERLGAGEIETLRRWIDGGASWPESDGKRTTSTHWSFQPIRRPSVPQTAAITGENPIDAFVLARLEQEGMKPSPEADRRTLARRLSLDLLGLAPSAGEVEAFADDADPQAYERLVDRLLASPHFGERWGRHWLDLARYGDSHGYENDGARPYAYRYRDWVIAAINGDLPFDQFTIEQLAGDLLPNSTPEQRIAAGFHRHTLKHNTSENAAEEYRVVAVKDRTDTTGVVWLGLTVGCAQCHSHKFDPLTQREYYGLYAFFNNADEHDEGEVSTFAAKPRATFVHLRGESADRLDLARWLVDEQHPLTARVAANHIWQHLFGEGLVATAEDFGAKGEKPSHPELLDYLASELRQRNWSRKRLIRQIIASRTYKQSSRHRADLAVKDPRNVLLARQNRFRVEAEVVRDLALKASGLLSAKIGGPSIQPPLPAGVAKLPLSNERLMLPTSGSEQYRRGLYINAQRTFPHPLLSTFDAADSNQSCPRRDRSTTPLQALTLLNDPVFFECAETIGHSVAREKLSDDDRLRSLFATCLSRAPSDRELGILREQFVAQRKHAPADDNAGWSSVAAVLLNLEEFVTRE